MLLILTNPSESEINHHFPHRVSCSCFSCFSSTLSLYTIISYYNITALLLRMIYPQSRLHNLTIHSLKQTSLNIRIERMNNVYRINHIILIEQITSTDSFIDLSHQSILSQYVNFSEVPLGTSTTNCLVQNNQFV